MRLIVQKIKGSQGFARARTNIGTRILREIDPMSETAAIAIPAGVTAVRDVRLSVSPEPWSYALGHAEAIEMHWCRRRAENPGFFNGRVLVLREGRIAGGVLHGVCGVVDFAAFLHWREHGYRDASVHDAFGSALILSSDGALMLARQSAGNLNAGLVYPPGGFIDPRDVAADGTIDIDGSIRREIAEETGLAVADLVRAAGFLISSNGPQTAIAAVFRAPVDATTLQAMMLSGSQADPERELIEMVAVRSAAEAADHPLPAWTAALVTVLFSEAAES